MLKHIDTVHEGNKPFKCESCERTFAHKGNMKKHILQGISYQLEHIYNLISVRLWNFKDGGS